MDVIDSGPERPAGNGRRRLRQTSRRVTRRLGALSRQQRRNGAVLAGVLLAILAMAGLRSGLPASGTETARDTAWAGPAGPPYDRLPGRTPIMPAILVSEDGQQVDGGVPLFGAAPSEAAARGAVDLVLGYYCRNPTAHAVQLFTQPRRFGPGPGRFPGLGGYPGPYPGGRQPTVPGVGPTVSPTADPPTAGPSPAPTTGGRGAAAPGSPTTTPSGPAATPARMPPWQFAVAVVTSPSSGRLDAVLRLYWNGSSYRWRGSLAQLNSCG
ncbi:MAG: hypothetical protein V7637_915 [Mycobacteriales bacterium]|jgi:hypothetical protein